MGYSAQRNYEINDKLRQYIEKMDKRPTAIADKAHIRRDTFSRIIRSKRPVYADELKPICDAMGISIGTLFEDPEN